ncbi:hypothetical protein [Mesorhizobium sp. WSM4962]|uniref:hypothetical protein n=1 Tax=Mesorhizobium sp. WSM4962 TaxID=3038548 RepID=UPI003FA60545
MPPPQTAQLPPTACRSRGHGVDGVAGIVAQVVVGAVAGHDEQRQFLADIDVQANLAGDFLVIAVIGDDAGDRTAVALVLHAADDMRNIAVDRAGHAGALFERDDAREAAVHIEVVADDVGVLDAVRNDRVLDDIARVTDELVIRRFVLTDAQAAELDPGEMQVGRLVGSGVGVNLTVGGDQVLVTEVEARFGVGLQRADLSRSISMGTRPSSSGQG